jgi:membrane-bound metal-dependent hydrolase YbcI (DUF457 family)
VGHFIGGVAAGWLVAGAPDAATKSRTRTRTWWREGLFFGILGALPDFDLIAGQHRGPSHSLTAAVIVGLVVCAVQASRQRTGAVRARADAAFLGAASAAAYASHVLLDWLGTDTSYPIGIMALWPFSHRHYESAVHLFLSTSRRYDAGWPFVEQNLMALTRELIVLVPVLVLVAFARRVIPARSSRSNQ